MTDALENTIKNLPKTPGVYFFKDKNGEVIYIGKAINLANRVRSYLNSDDQKTKIMFSQVSGISFRNVFSEFESLLLEAALINKYKPKYNIRLRDDKSFLYIAITDEEFPKVLAVRKNDIAAPRFLFGPFPSAKTVRQVLRFLRRIFPYCNQKDDKKPCFWSHIGLCNPCPGQISKLTGRERQQKKREYLFNIKSLASLLSGQSKEMIEELNIQMNENANNQNYENAAVLRDKIDKISWITTHRFSISSYLENQYFFEEEQEREITSLRSILNSFFQNTINLRRIECYDISNILGQFATGSMVVFVNGIADKNGYRHFRIRMENKPNDTAMMTEVLKRRLKHQEWDYPELIVVDGGMGQVTAANNCILEAGIDIPVIGLAKRLEEIIIKTKNNEWKVTRLPDASPALNLLKRIRDESHRFALSYHRKLRSSGWDIKLKDNQDKTYRNNKT